MSDPCFTIRKLDLQGRAVLSYRGVVIERGQCHVCVEAFFDRPRVDRGCFVFERGDRFVEWFYADRWYNVFEVHAARDDRLKGWYCNITKAARIDVDSVSAVDLALDVWVRPDRTYEVLDEDEFERLEIDVETRRRARAALAEVLCSVGEHRAPFVSGKSSDTCSD